MKPLLCLLPLALLACDPAAPALTDTGAEPWTADTGLEVAARHFDADASAGTACGNHPSDFGSAPTGYYTTWLQGMYSEVWVPRSYTPDRSYPILLHLHGTWSSSGWNAYFFPSHELVDDLGFIQVMPNAPSTMWSWVPDYTIDAIIDDVAATYNVDRRRIYVGGHSQGASTALRYAANRTTPAAVLPYAGYEYSAPKGRTSLFNFQGLWDTMVWASSSEWIHGIYLSALGCGSVSSHTYTAGWNSVTAETASCSGGAEVRAYWEHYGGHMAVWGEPFLRPVLTDLVEIYHPDGCQ